MISALRKLERKLDRVEDQARGVAILGQYRDDPAGYARDILGVHWWAKQQEVAHLLCTPPYRVLVRASHEVGKTYLAGSLVNWFYDTRSPGLCLTTAPTDTQVRDLLWKEVRVQRRRAGRGGFRGPKMPRLESSEDHWAYGFTARDADGFQGRHEAEVFVLFDEAAGVRPEFWDAAETMAHMWLAILNPTDPSSRAAEEERSGRWHVVEMSGLDHPNIAAELAGQPPPFPAALRLGKLQERLEKWCTPLGKGEIPKPTDVEWPPGSGKWLRPGPVAEARVLGRWPSQSVNSVWSDVAWLLAETMILPDPQHALPEFGCDVARYGDDFTSIHGRRGGISFHHETHNGWSTKQTAERLKMLATEHARIHHVDRKRILVKIDDSGVGGGVTDQGGPEYSFVPILAASKPLDEDQYRLKRDELWFAVAALAAEGRISFARLATPVRQELRRQAIAITYKLDAAARKVIETKDDTKKKIKRSPDDMDAVNLAYAAAPPMWERVAGQVR